MEIHLKIPAERWCITRKEFFSFIGEVGKLWKRGALPDDEEQPNPHHDHPRYGPNLYQVNMHYVKPVTRDAGGMSYALMKHPQGLLCQVFVSHAWAEGIFELGSHVERAWPRGLGLHNLYCCLLGNPQNLDIESLLDGPPIESPFAKAMQCASHVLVIPNDSVSIYKRLWCVYEIYLATQWKKTCILPAKPRSSAIRSMVTWSALLPTALGSLAGTTWAIILISQDEPPHAHARAVDLLLAMTLSLMIFTASMDVLDKRWSCPALYMNTVVRRVVHAGMQIGSSLCIVPFCVLPCGFPGAYGQVLHYGIPFGVWITTSALGIEHRSTELETQELKHQASRLSFNGLEDATCSNAVDETRIRSAIVDYEEDVVMGIKVLRSAGAYNNSLRRAHTKGLDIRGSGSAHIEFRLGALVVPWIVCLIEELSACKIWTSCSLPPDSWTYACALVILACGVVIIATAVFWLQHGPDKVNLLISTCMKLGLVANLVPFLVAILQGWDEIRRLPIFVRFSHFPTPVSCPSLATWIVAVPFRPVMAIMALALGWLGSLCLYAAGADNHARGGQDLESSRGAETPDSGTTDSDKS